MNGPWGLLPDLPPGPLALLSMLVGGILLSTVLLRLGGEGFPVRLLRDGLALGIVGAMALTPFEPLFYLAVKALSAPGSAAADPAATAFLRAAIPEEILKAGMFALFAWPHVLRRSARDGVIGAAAVGLGFGLIENVFYALNRDNGAGASASVRILVSAPSHMLDGLVFGYAFVRGMGLGAGLRRWLWIGAGLAIVMVLHGFFDWPVFFWRNHAGSDLAADAALSALDQRMHLMENAACAGVAALALLVAFRLKRLDDAQAPMAPPRLAAPGIVQRALLAWPTGALLGAGLLYVGLAAQVWTALVMQAADGQSGGGFAGLALVPMALGVMAMTFPRTPPARAHGEGGVRRDRHFHWRVPATLLILLAMLLALEPAAERYGRDAEVAEALARAAKLQQAGDVQGAVAAYTAALEKRPESVPLLLGRAVAEGAMQDFAAKLADARRARQSAPEDGGVLIFLAHAEADMHKSAEARADLDLALKLGAANVDLWRLRSRLDREDGFTQDAIDDLNQAMLGAPDDPGLMEDQADALMTAGRLAEAIKLADKGLSIDAARASIRFLRGRAELLMGDAAAAKSDLLAADKDRAFIYPAYWLYFAQARTGEAPAVYFRARAAQQPPGEAWPAPVTRMVLGSIDAAAARAAAANDDQRCEADFYGAELSLLKGAGGEAMASFDEALRECPRTFVEYAGALAERGRLDAPAGVK